MRFLRRCVSANPEISRRSVDERIAWQANQLRLWVDGCQHEPAETVRLRPLDSGAEHAVFLNYDGTYVLKVTLPGIYGDYYYLDGNRISQERCTPLQYLIRLRLLSRLFNFNAYLFGLTAENQIVTLQTFVNGEPPTQEEVDAYLATVAVPIRQSAWLWQWENTQSQIYLGDARADNFVRTPDGLVPIDLRLWLGTLTDKEAVSS